MRNVTCKCDASFDADLPDEVDLDKGGGILGLILSGDFMVTSCPSCGAVLKPELRVRLTSKKMGLDLIVLPELERSSLYLGTADLAAGAEVLVGYAELLERARILTAGLDPESIEIIKLWLLERAEEKAPEAFVTAAYAETKEGRLLFHLEGLREGEIAVLPVDKAIYDRAVADKAKSKREKPFDKIFQGPYRSVRVLEFDNGD
jgi:hypothetical protein